MDWQKIKQDKRLGQKWDIFDGEKSKMAAYGKLGLLGAPPKLEFNPTPLIFKQIRIYGSLIGPIEQTKEVIELCAKNKILIPVELIHPRDIETSYERMLKSDVKYRFAIDIEAMRREE